MLPNMQEVMAVIAKDARENLVSVGRLFAEPEAGWRPIQGRGHRSRA
jgi:hypothetical protein